MKRVTLLKGDGIGPEVVDAAVKVVDALELGIEWEERETQTKNFPQIDRYLPYETLESIRKNGVALKGPTGTPIGEGHRSINVSLRQKLNLYANVRPAVTMDTVSRDPIDLIIVRENTEGLYSGLEHEVTTGVVESIRVITELASKRIATFAFELARTKNRKRVTAVHKANILKLSDGLFLNAVREVSTYFKDIEYDEMIVDAATMQLVMNPKSFDILVMENLFGDIMSDAAAGIVGGLGLTPGANIGDGCAVFEAVHGTAPDIAGKGIANPTALMLSAALMLDYMGETNAAKRLDASVRKAIGEGNRTRDLGGNLSTNEFSNVVITNLDKV